MSAVRSLCQGIGRDFARHGKPLYYFKLVDPIRVADHGVHELADDAAARIDALKLARSLRETRPELIGMHYSVWVTSEDGAGVCLIPLDANYIGTKPP